VSIVENLDLLGRKNERLALNLILCFLIYLASFKNTFVGKICRSKLLGRVGISCYSIYFLHFTVIRNVNTLLDNNFYSSYFLAASTELKFLFYGIIVTLISIFVGRISFHLIEVPSVKIGSYFISKINAKKALPSEVEIPEAVETP